MTSTPKYVFVIRQQAEVNVNRYAVQECDVDESGYTFVNAYRRKSNAERRLSEITDNPAVNGYYIVRAKNDDPKFIIQDS